MMRSFPMSIPLGRIGVGAGLRKKKDGVDVVGLVGGFANQKMAIERVNWSGFDQEEYDAREWTPVIRVKRDWFDILVKTMYTMDGDW